MLFGEIRRAGNAANHALEGNHRGALSALKITWQLSLWFHRAFSDPSYKSGPFISPSPPKDESAELRAEMDRLDKVLKEYQATHHETAGQLEATEEKLRLSRNEQAFWEQMAAEAEQAKAALEKRSALGEQAANAFKDTRMENLQTFADTFGIKELEEQATDSDNAVHIATIQGMVQRLLYAAEGSNIPAVDQYDCIIVDECHRGYLLDRELSDTEMIFRGYKDYISKYRRVLDYFDACKIGLTATPALHTTQIFGAPVYTYSYREAVIDGYLVDYEPPVQIRTELSTNGIAWKAGEEVKVYDARRNQINMYNAPDEIKLEVEDFNRRVITEAFNRVVCEYLAQELDPASVRKTLIYCVTDAHADMVVDLLKKAFAARYGSVDDDAVIKITGAADKPLSLIRRYKNERNPNVAVTVDLLTTGIDVPEICNLVFLRRVNSRILFDQMLGRATRLCDEIEKEAFRVFDAVGISEAIGDMTAMKPVVVDPKITFAQLSQELASVGDDSARQLVRDQFLAKLQGKKRHLSEKSAHDFETRAGMTPDEFIKKLKAMPLNEVAAWFTQNPDLGEILDRKGDGASVPLFISEHEDKFHSAERGYGKAKKPEDYLKEFTAFFDGGRELLWKKRKLTCSVMEKLKRQAPVADGKSVNAQVDKAMARRNTGHKPAPNHPWRNVPVGKSAHDGQHAAT